MKAAIIISDNLVTVYDTYIKKFSLVRSSKFDKFDRYKSSTINYSLTKRLNPFSAVANLNEKAILLTGGLTKTKIYLPSKEVLMFDLSTNKWSNFFALESERFSHSCAWINSKVFVIGGYIDSSNSPATTIEVYGSAEYMECSWKTIYRNDMQLCRSNPVTCCVNEH